MRVRADRPPPCIVVHSAARLTRYVHWKSPRRCAPALKKQRSDLGSRLLDSIGTLAQHDRDSLDKLAYRERAWRWCTLIHSSGLRSLHDRNHRGGKLVYG